MFDEIKGISLNCFKSAKQQDVKFLSALFIQ